MLKACVSLLLIALFPWGGLSKKRTQNWDKSKTAKDEFKLDNVYGPTLRVAGSGKANHLKVKRFGRKIAKIEGRFWKL